MSLPEHQQEQDIDLSNMKGPFSIRVKGHVVYVGADGNVETRPDIVSVPEIKAPELFPEASDQDSAQKEAHEPLYDIGEHIEGEGVYLGVWEPKDGFGQSLNRIFDLYAAPEDLKTRNGKQNRLLTIDKALKYISGRSQLHGHSGGLFKNEQAVMKAAVDNPQALESWFIPTEEMLRDHLYYNKDKGVLKGTFQNTKDIHFRNSSWYWSCTESDADQTGVFNADFSGRFFSGWSLVGADRRSAKRSTRPVRAVLRP